MRKTLLRIALLYRPRLFHSFMRNRKLDRPRVGPLMVNGEFCDDPNTIANAFVEAFSPLFYSVSCVNVFV